MKLKLILLLFVFVHTIGRSQQLAWVSDVGAKKFPGATKQFVVNRYGAKADGKTMNTKFIQKAIDACAKNGGGIGLSNNGSKATSALSADLFGATLPSDHRIPALMQNPQYWLSVAWQNVAYNQPPYTDYFLSDGMKQPDSPEGIIVSVK